MRLLAGSQLGHCCIPTDHHLLFCGFVPSRALDVVCPILSLVSKTLKNYLVWSSPANLTIWSHTRAAGSCVIVFLNWGGICDEAPTIKAKTPVQGLLCSCLRSQNELKEESDTAFRLGRISKLVAFYARAYSVRDLQLRARSRIPKTRPNRQGVHKLHRGRLNVRVCHVSHVALDQGCVKIV